MRKRFNITGDCRPDRHYMVNIDSRLAEIKAMVDEGDYFTINRARQYGKTTTLTALGYYLEKAYVVVSLDFQMMSQSDFADERSFVEAFAREVLDNIPETANIPENISGQLQKFADGEEDAVRLKQAFLFRYLSEWCGQSEKPIVLLIDEVDNATNNQVFMDFLGQLRGHYLKRNKKPTFQSVILAGVYDVKNMKRKLRPEDEHRNNSPWNTRAGNEPGESLLSSGDCPRDQMVPVPFDIAVDFCVDMSFSAGDIAGMLEEYEVDYNTGMDIQAMSELIYDYTSGYPFLVSKLCKLMDERIAGSEEFPDRNTAWTREGFLEAVKCLLIEKNTLFESLASKLYNYPELKKLIYAMLMRGEKVTYNPDNSAIDMASMFGFVKSRKGIMVIANRVFETRIYNFLLSEEELNSKICSAGAQDKNQFICSGRLDMKRVLERFVIHWEELYGSEDEKFIEDSGRKLFLLYLKPIINGVGNYYVEARTRDNRRTDVVVDYRGEQFVIELKIWHGNAYNERGEEQLSEYLDYFHLNKGYMLSFNFNKKKRNGVKEIMVGDKVIVEAIV